jgi:hypothetical protein
VDSGSKPWAGSGKYTLNNEQWTVDNGQETFGSRQWAEGNGTTEYYGIQSVWYRDLISRNWTFLRNLKFCEISMVTQ